MTLEQEKSGLTSRRLDVDPTKVELLSDGSYQKYENQIGINPFSKLAIRARMEHGVPEPELKEGVNFDKERYEKNWGDVKDEMMRRKNAENKIANDYDKLIEKYAVVPVTADNLKIIMAYLNENNWGGWKLPKLEIGYSANQHDCEGEQATTITLERPVKTDTGETVNKFSIGAPRGYLSKYRPVNALKSIKVIDKPEIKIKQNKGMKM